jgi:hypothetical protein
MRDLNSSSACLSLSSESVVAKENFETDKKRDRRRMVRKVGEKKSLKLITGCSMGEGESCSNNAKIFSFYTFHRGSKRRLMTLDFDYCYSGISLILTVSSITQKA